MKNLAPTLAVLMLLISPAAWAGEAGSPRAPLDLRAIRIDQRLGEEIPLDLPFRDESGAEVRLSRYFGARPVVLALVYYGCPMLCGEVLNGLAGSARTLSLAAGKDFEIVVVSFDPRETSELAAAKKRSFAARSARPGGSEGWHFLTGDPEPIRKLTEAVGFRYAWDDALDQYAHASGITVLSPGGRISRYFLGAEYPPRDLSLSIVEASQGKVGSLTDRLMLLCYRYDPQTGTYGVTVLSAIRTGGIATVAALGAFIALTLRRERRDRRARRGGASR